MDTLHNEHDNTHITVLQEQADKNKTQEIEQLRNSSKSSSKMRTMIP